MLTAAGPLDCETVGDLAVALGLPTQSVSPDPANYCLCNARLDDLNARCATEAEGWPSPGFIIDRMAPCA